MRTEPIGNCGCKLVRTEAGLHMTNCPLHEAAPELVDALKNTLRALETHLDLESRRTNISRSGICPCETNEVAQARAALRHAGEEV